MNEWLKVFLEIFGFLIGASLLIGSVVALAFWASEKYGEIVSTIIGVILLLASIAGLVATVLTMH